MYLTIIILFLAIKYLLDLSADLLNLKHLKADLPEEFLGFYDSGKFRTSQEYLKDSTRFEIVTNTISLAALLIVILLGGFNTADKIARGFGLSEIPTGLIFAGILGLTVEVLSLPFSVYHTFGIEKKYGFNKTTVKTYILDFFKALTLGALAGGIVLSGALWIFLSTGRAAWVICWAAMTIFSLLISYIVPVLIMPLFNKFTPLEEGDLKRAVMSYAEGRNFKIKDIYLMDGSRRSTKSNAFFTGFGASKRVVLYDTLLEKLSKEEILAILAHEIGHYKKRDILKMMLLSFLTNGLMFYLLSFFLGKEELFSAFEMEEISLYAGFLFFAFLYSPVSFLFSIMYNNLSRKHEKEADAFTLSTTGSAGPLISALKKLSVNNLSNLTPHPFKVFLEYTHPPVLERIGELKRREWKQPPEATD